MAGRVALVTGSSSGIGKGIAQRFAAEGASVMVTGLEDLAGRAVAEEVRGAFHPGDLTDPAQGEALVAATVERFGALHTLVNCAGDPTAARGGDGPLHTTDVEFWDHMYRSTLRSAMVVSKAAIPHLRESGRGRIVHISSVQALRGWGWDAYTMAKSGLVGLTKSMAVSYATERICVNCIAVGSVVVERTESYWATEQGKRMWERIGLTRQGVPADVAHACVWLGSDEAEFVTGSIVSVDGGMAARGTYTSIR